MKSVCFAGMKATLTELRRDTIRVLRPVIHGAKTVTLTEHGQEVAEISPEPLPDRRRALVPILERIRDRGLRREPGTRVLMQVGPS